MILKQAFILGILLLIIKPTNACTCWPIDSISAKELIEDVEFMIIGHAIKNINYNPEINRDWDNRQKGFEVVFKIDSIITGDIELKEVILNQFSTGNCVELFKFGEQYLIYGNRLVEFVNRTTILPKVEDGEIPITTIQPPPPSSIHDSKMFCYNHSQEQVDYWNQLAKENVVIFTSQCSSLSMKSQLVKFFLNQ